MSGFGRLQNEDVLLLKPAPNPPRWTLQPVASWANKLSTKEDLCVPLMVVLPIFVEGIGLTALGARTTLPGRIKFLVPFPERSPFLPRQCVMEGPLQRQQVMSGYCRGRPRLFYCWSSSELCPELFQEC